MAIEKRGKNSWRVGIQVQTPDGWQWVRKTIKMPPGMPEAKQRREAEKALARLELDVESGKIISATRAQTVRELAELWFEQHVIPNLAATTHATYKNILDVRILPTLGDVPLRRLTPLVINRWLLDMRKSPRVSTALPDGELKRPRPGTRRLEYADNADKRSKPLSARTIQHYYDTLSSMLDKAVQWDLMDYNPMDKVDRPKARKSRVNYLSEERAVDLLRCLKDEPNMCFRAAVLLALLCGLRLGEVGALRLEDVDWRHGTIDISRALKYTPDAGNFVGTTKTEAGERLIALPPGMMAVLHETREYQQDTAALVGDVWKGDGWIVHGWNGERVHHDTPSKWFRKFADAHGFEGVRFHDLRHTHATILLANNIDAVAVASRLGHSDASVTLRVYAHALRRRDEDAARVMQAIFDGVDSDL